MKEEYYLQIEYNMISNVSGYDPDRYVNKYHIKVSARTLEEDTYEEVGRGFVVLILDGLAINHHYNLFDVFDFSQATLELGERIYDFEQRQINEDLQQFFEYDFINSNILLLERLELIKRFRGLGLGKKVIKDIIERFSGCAGLIALKAFPLQFERIGHLNESWVERIGLGDLEKDEEKAKYRLYNYYQSIGSTNPFNDEFFFINPALVIEKLDRIELE